jgi:hypothetical protein
VKKEVDIILSPAEVQDCESGIMNEKAISNDNDPKALPPPDGGLEAWSQAIFAHLVGEILDSKHYSRKGLTF